MARENPGISDAEMDALKVLWEHGLAPVRDVAAQLKRRKRVWAYTTVQTLLNRLEAKGYVTADRARTPHVFRAAVTREALVRRRLRDLAENLTDGAATPLVAALVRDRRFTEAEIAEFRRIIDELEP